jgi:hypothetical protein
MDNELQTIATSLILHLKPCIRTTSKTFQNFKAHYIVGNHLVLQKKIKINSMTYLYLSKPIPCLLTKTPLMYAIVCSLKKFMTISWNYRPTIHLRSLFSSLLTILGLC